MDQNNQPDSSSNLQPKIAEDTAPPQAPVEVVVPTPTTPETQPVVASQPVAPAVMEGPVEDNSDGEGEPPVKKGISPLVWVVVAVLFIFVLVGGYFILQQTLFSQSGSSEADVVTGVEIPPTATPAPQVLPEINQVPTVSDDASLRTIDNELNNLNAGDPETDLKTLDAQASQL